MERAIAKALLDIEAVFLRPNDPFTWSSGIKSPIYCDNRLTLSYPDIRDMIERSFVELINDHFPTCDYIMGTATAGISHAAIIADKMKLPMGYVRTSSKGHGRENAIEGKQIDNANVVVVEDLISTGGSSIRCVKALQDAGYNVLGVIAIFSYELEQAKRNFNQINLPYKALSTYDVLIETALANNDITKQDINKLKAFRKNPNDSSWIRA